MTAPRPDEAERAQRFGEAVRRCEQRPSHASRPASVPVWRVALVGRAANWICCFCGVALAHPGNPTGARLIVDLVVPKRMGGSLDPENLLAACRACVRERGGRDLLAWQPDALPETLAALRRAELERGATLGWRRGDPRRTNRRAVAERTERWSHPRFVAYAGRSAHGVFVAGTSWENLPPSFAAVLRALGGARSPWGVWRLPPERWAESLAAALALNAWVHQVEAAAWGIAPADAGNAAASADE